MNDFSSYSRYSQFINQKILAIDFGARVIGTAMYCPGTDPFPYMGEKIRPQGHADSIEKIKTIVANEEIKVLVLGVPYFLDGKITQNTLHIKNFGQELKKACPSQQFFEQDETLSTKAAEDRMKSSPQFNFKINPLLIDCLSAVIILEDFIRT